ncbi:MAG: 2-hydroxyacyl-CoA dehydratase [Desulfobacteraceae bacterium]|nr:MAG: 2-hydroxyacyl-CoA dehydratase [Desulfobacteraceae bacterium]
MKDTLATAKHFVERLPGLAKDFFHYSIIGYFFETKSFQDAFIYTKYWAFIWGNIFKLVIRLFFKKGPVAVVRFFMQYPWILRFLTATKLLRRLTKGRKGAYLESTALVIHAIAVLLVEKLEEVIYQPERLLINEDLVPPEIAMAMGLNVWLVEGMGILLPFLNSEACLGFIDEAENAGMNPDSCSFVKSAVGMVIKNQQPKGCAMVSSNMPCDAGMASYSYIEKQFDIPTYRVDVPYNFHNERAEKLFVEDLKGMIAFLEKHTPGRMDWEKLRDICEKRNYMMELELELWDMMRVSPAPLASEAIWLSHLFLFHWFPGNKFSIRLYERLVELAKKNLAAKIPAVENEKYRAVLWNPPFPQFPDIFNLVERAHGITLIMDSMSYNHHDLIDTSTPESMLGGLAKIIMDGPMVRHTRGPAENYLDDIFRCYKQFDLDMVWIANHVGCKGGQAMNGILREKCREMKIPLLVLDYDLLDPRIVSHEGMMKQVDDFMETVMKPRQPLPAL